MSVVLVIDHPDGSREIHEAVAGSVLPVASPPEPESRPLHHLATTGVPA